MTIWVVGATSFIGKALIVELENLSLAFRSTSTSGENADLKLDLSKTNDFDFSQFLESDTLVLLAGVSSPELCESEPEVSYQVNVLGTTKVIQEMLDRGGKVLFASSDTVYGETHSPAKETAQLRPIGNYAKMKASIEDKFNGSKSFIAFRLSYVVGSNDKLSTYIKSSVLHKEVPVLFSGIYRNAVEIADVITGLKNLLQTWPDDLETQAVNFCGRSCISRVEIANYVLARNGLSTVLSEIEPPSGFFDVRPRKIFLDYSTFTSILGKHPIALNDEIKTNDK